MNRFIHDQFAKQYLTELLSPFGQVETDKDVASELRKIDLWFIPSPQPRGDRKGIGLLGQLATNSAVFEPFRNPVNKYQIRDCMGKLFDIHRQLHHQAERDNLSISQIDLPYLWILTPTASDNLLQDFRAIADQARWMDGVYLMADYLYTGIIAIHQLPCTPATLWLRILGRGSVQQQAMQELEALPKNNIERSNTKDLVANFLTVLEERENQHQDLDEDERSLLMQLSSIYKERIEQATKD